MKRSQTNDYTPYGGMHKQDHILRLARGAEFCNLSLSQFIKLLEIYIDAEDDTVLDHAPLMGYWNLGGVSEHLTQRALDFAICAPEYHASLDEQGDRFCRMCGLPLSQ